MEIDVLMDVLDDLRRKDYEYAMTELSDHEGGIFDQLKSLISARMYRDAIRIIHEKVDAYIIERETMWD